VGVPNCPPGKGFCGGSCYSKQSVCSDLLSTLWQCGACNNVCPNGGPNTVPSCVAGQCKITCNSSQHADCNGDLLGDGCEQSVTNDPLHCGSCGHSCLPGGCGAGSCLAYAIAAAQSNPLAIDLDAASLYWANGGTGGPDGEVVRSDKTPGATPTILASGRVSPVGLVVAAGVVYWAEKGHSGQSDGGLWAVPSAGGAPVAVATSVAYPLGIAADANNLYWTAHEGAAVYAAPLGGGPPTQLGAVPGPRRITVDATHAYVTQLNGTLSRIPLGGGSVDVLAAGLNDPWGLVVDATNAYVRLASGTLVSVPLGGGATKTLAVGLDASIDVTLDGTDLLYGSQGVLYKTPVGAGGKVSLAPHPATAVVADANGRFWVESGSGVVRGLTR